MIKKWKSWQTLYFWLLEAALSLGWKIPTSALQHTTFDRVCWPNLSWGEKKTNPKFTDSIHSLCYSAKNLYQPSGPQMIFLMFNCWILFACFFHVDFCRIEQMTLIMDPKSQHTMGVIKWHFSKCFVILLNQNLFWVPGRGERGEKGD